MVNKTKVVLIGIMVLLFFSFNLYAAGYKLKWGSVSDATGYKIRYGTSLGNYTTTSDVGNVTEYNLNNFSLSEGATYYFVVRAYNQFGESGDSDYATHIVPIPPDTTPPLYPQNVSATLQGTGIRVTWQAVSAPDLSKYKVYYGLQSRMYGPAIPAGNVTAYVISGLEAGKKYYVGVSAVDTSDNESGYSPEFTIDIPAVVVDTAPVITITAPVPSGAYTSLTSGITVTGTATDDKGVTQIKWSNSLGGNGTATGTTSWSTGSIPLLEGTNTISVTAYDTAAKTASSSIQVIYQAPDTQIPVVTLTYPTTGTTYTTTQTSVNLSGSATDNKGVSKVTWLNSKTGESGTGTGTSNWSISNVTLISGVNSIAITAQDLTGNQASVTLSVTCNAVAAVENDTEKPTTLVGSPTTSVVGNSSSVVENDTEKPAILLVSPATTGATYTTDQAALNLSGTATDNKGVSKVTWLNSKTGESGIASGTGTSNWSISNMLLASEVNLIVITAYDLTGNQASVTLSVTYNMPDTEKPMVALLSPTTGQTYTTSQASVSLTGAAADNKGVTKVTWSNSKTGGGGTATGTATWSINNIILMEGDNTIAISAYDNAGNIGTYAVVATYKTMVVVDTISPSISLGFPVTGTAYSASVTPITLAGSASDNVGVTKVDWTNSKGGSGTATGTSNWTLENVALQEGSNAIVITAYDAAGNTATHTLMVTYTIPDTQKPVITLLSPTTGTTFDTGSEMITLSGTSTDNKGVVRISWTNTNGTFGTASGTTSWSIANIGLKVGLNTIIITAYDAADNKSVHSLTVNYTLPAPVAIEVPSTEPDVGTEPQISPEPAPETPVINRSTTTKEDTKVIQKQKSQNRRDKVTTRFLRLFGIGL